MSPCYVKGFIEGCLERIGEDDPEEEQLFRDLLEDETQRGVVMESLKAGCEVRRGGLRNIDLQQCSRSFKTNLGCGTIAHRGAFLLWSVIV